jgi:flagellar basal body-associated protein FliL
MTHAHRPPRDPADLLQALLGESQKLSSDVAERERRQRTTNALICVGIFVVLVMVGALVVLMMQSRQRGNTTRELLRSGNASAEKIAECTTIGQPCYEAGQQRTNAALEQLIRAQLAIQVCADRTDTEAGLRSCVAQELAAAAPTTPVPVPSIKGKR